MNFHWRQSLGAGVSLGFVVVLVLMAVYTVTGMTQMSSVNRNIDQLVNKDGVKVALVHEMITSLRERAVGMHVIALTTDPFDQDEEFIRLGELGGKFSRARNELMSMELGEKESAILEDLHRLTVITQPLFAEVIDKSMNGDNQAALDLIAEETAPNQRAIMQHLSDLLLIQQQRAQATVEKTDTTYNSARWYMAILGGVVILLGFIIAFAVVRLTTHQAELLQHQAMYDGLTQLPNRRLFADRLYQSALLSRRENQPFALVAMDLNRFKEINDTLGHHVGDEVLKKTAHVVRDCLRESDTLARMGGDEFTLLLQTAQTIDGAIIVAKRILERLGKPVDILGHELEIGTSMGIAMFLEHAQELDELQRNADAAMYQAKRTHTGYAVYSPEMDEQSDGRLELQTSLRKAIEAGELVLHYQPKIDFSTHNVSGVEALVRWNHPTRGMLPPDRFISFAEETGLIKPLTENVLRMAVKQGEEWLKAGKQLSIAVNVSAINIQDPDFAGQVETILQEHQLPPRLLELELTESAVMSEPDKAVLCIRQLHGLGVQVSIDDFGTGYTSMSQLKELLVAKIKIDRSFVKDMVSNHSDAIIVRTTLDLGHNLGFKVVAEGVENQQTWDELEALGCDSAQGFHMGRPLPADEFSEWLNKGPWKSGEEDDA